MLRQTCCGTLGRTGLSWILSPFDVQFCFTSFFQGPLRFLLNPLPHIIIPVTSYWHWLITFQVENTWRVFRTAQLKRETFSHWVCTLPSAPQRMEMLVTCSIRRKRAAPRRPVSLLQQLWCFTPFHSGGALIILKGSLKSV